VVLVLPHVMEGEEDILPESADRAIVEGLIVANGRADNVTPGIIGFSVTGKHKHSIESVL